MVNKISQLIGKRVCIGTDAQIKTGDCLLSQVTLLDISDEYFLVQHTTGVITLISSRGKFMEVQSDD